MVNSKKSAPFLDKLKVLKKENKTEFYSVAELAKEIDIKSSTLYNYKDQLVDLGFSFDKKEKEQIALLSSKLKDLDKKLFFSFTELSKAVKLPSNIIMEYQDILASNNIKIMEIKDYIDFKIVELTKTKETEFESLVAFSKKIEISVNLLRDKKEFIESKGITILSKTMITKRKMESAFKGLKTKSFASYLELTKITNIDHNTLRKNQELLDKYAIKITSTKSNKKKEVDTALAKLKKEGKTEFENFTELHREINLSSPVFLKIECSNLLEKHNIKVTRKSEATKENVLKEIERLKNEGKTVLDNYDEASRELSLPKQLLISNYKKFIAENGILIREKASKQLEFTGSNYYYLISEFQERGIRIENTAAFIELGEDFFDTKINSAKIELDSIVYTSGLIESFNFNTIKKIIENAIINLTYNEENLNYTTLELKYQILLDGFYLSNTTITDTLQAIQEKTSKETIKTRMRLAKKIVDTKHLVVDFRDTLPDLNNNKEGHAIILNSIKNDLLVYWKEYLLYAIKNNLVSKSATRAKISIETGETIDSVLKKNNQYAKAFFLEKEEAVLFKRLGFDGLLALYLYGIKNASSLEERYRGLNSFITGFFLWLTKENKGLFHCKLLRFNGNGLVVKMSRKIFANHIVIQKQEDIKNSKEVPKKILNRLSSDRAELHRYLLASSTKPNADIANISAEDIQNYLRLAKSEGPSGTIQHSAYSRDLLRYSGNINALEIPESYSVKDYYLRLIHQRKIHVDITKNYKKLIKEMLEVVEFDKDNSGKSEGYVLSTIDNIVLLLEFLECFPKKLKRKELSNVLNPIIKTKDKPNMHDWAIKKGVEKKYKAASSRYLMLFDNISQDNEYYKLYNKKWILLKKNSDPERTILRNGFDYSIYLTFQNVAINNPPKTPEIPIVRTAPSGEKLDMSWWKHNDTNPIIAVCNWLTSKLPRRTAHIRHLDVNTFLSRDDSGNIIGFYFNTDKNKSTNAKNRFIPLFLLDILFTKEEMKFIENYVNYIKKAYSHYSPVEYENGGKYEPIQPLFPSPTKNSVLERHLLIGFYNKTILKTQYEVNRLASIGSFDKLYNDTTRETKIEYLKTCKLLFELPSGKHTLPDSIDSLEEIDYSLSAWNNSFHTKEGIHNMRHAGASNLLSREGLSLIHIKMITGHTSIDTLANIYIKPDENSLKVFASRVSEKMSDFIDAPTEGGGQFIRENLIPLTKSNNPKLIQEELEKNGFMSLPRAVKDRPIELYGKTKRSEDIVDNGIEIASRLHPDTYEVLNHGICTVSKRCPSESNCACCLCPHLIFNATHTKGVIYKQQKTMIDMKMLQDQLRTAHETGNISSRAELQTIHNSRTSELIGWNEMVLKISDQLNDLNFPTEKEENIPSTTNKKQNFFYVREVEPDEMIMELLCTAEKLNIQEQFTDHMTSKISNKLLLNGIKNNDKDLLKKMEKGSIDWLINEFGTKAIEERRDFLMPLLNSSNNTNLIEQKEDEPLEIEILT